MIKQDQETFVIALNDVEIARVKGIEAAIDYTKRHNLAEGLEIGGPAEIVRLDEWNQRPIIEP